MFSQVPPEQRMTVVLFLIMLVVPYLRKQYLYPDTIVKKIVINTRYPFFDLLKGIAICSVVFIHTLILFMISINDRDNYFMNIFNNMARFAVPLFIVCTGVLLDPEKAVHTINFYIKKFIVIYIPYVISCLIIYIYSPGKISDFFYQIITGKILLPYYYLVVLLQLYVLYPFLLKIYKKKWFLTTSLIVTLLFYFLPNLWHIFGIPVFFPYLYFFSYGMVNRNRFLSDNESTRVIPWLLIIFTYIGMLFIWNTYYYNMIYVYGIAVINVFFFYKKQMFKSILSSLFQIFGKNSFYIFLVHYPIIHYMLLITKPFIRNSPFYLVIIFFMTSLSSLGMALLIRKIWTGFLYVKYNYIPKI